MPYPTPLKEKMRAVSEISRAGSGSYLRILFLKGLTVQLNISIVQIQAAVEKSAAVDRKRGRVTFYIANRGRRLYIFIELYAASCNLLVKSGGILLRQLERNLFFDKVVAVVGVYRSSTRRRFVDSTSEGMVFEAIQTILRLDIQNRASSSPPAATMSCLSWKLRKRSSVKITERAYEGTEAFHP